MDAALDITRPEKVSEALAKFARAQLPDLRTSDYFPNPSSRYGDWTRQSIPPGGLIPMKGGELGPINVRQIADGFEVDLVLGIDRRTEEISGARNWRGTVTFNSDGTHRSSSYADTETANAFPHIKVARELVRQAATW